MIPIGSNFHKTIYKRVKFSLFFPPTFFMIGKGINIFLKIKSILILLVLEILKITSSLVLVLTNRVIFILFHLFINILFILKS
jgi:hypothetical protein